MFGSTSCVNKPSKLLTVVLWVVTFDGAAELFRDVTGLPPAVLL